MKQPEKYRGDGLSKASGGVAAAQDVAAVQEQYSFLAQAAAKPVEIPGLQANDGGPDVRPDGISAETSDSNAETPRVTDQRVGGALPHGQSRVEPVSVVVHQPTNHHQQQQPVQYLASGGHQAQQRGNDEIKRQAQAWAHKSGFTQEQMTELSHLMTMVAASHIDPRLLSKMQAIDRGMFGTIFKSSLGGAAVAVKQLGDCSPSSFKQRMRELLLELRVLTRLSHPNIVKFYGTAADFTSLHHSGPYVGLVFSFCDRGSLDRALFNNPNKLSVPMRLSICRQMSEALTYMHCKRVVHRDLNTKNILLTHDMKAQIADFGCARQMSTDVLRTTTISGSPAYMAPEQITGEPLTLAVDVWAFSIILWEVMVNIKPWEGVVTDFNQLRQGIVNGLKLEIPSNTGYPAAFIQAIKLGMQTKARDRPAMAALRQELTNALVYYKPSNKQEEKELEHIRLKMHKEQDELIQQYVQQQQNKMAAHQAGEGGAQAGAGAAGLPPLPPTIENTSKPFYQNGSESSPFMSNKEPAAAARGGLAAGGQIEMPRGMIGIQGGEAPVDGMSPSPGTNKSISSVADYNVHASAPDEDQLQQRKGVRGFLRNLCFLV
uniref:Protein kinase domain-containing protein n=1 Tax=Hemiselmis andersenii TaxID=464988 RepID=A0A6U4L2H0_HEMAN|mmetsp:Transcript_487/g.1128  ORF Transcript_487/g.1128 Transcript_487/m.1128 type:complete len:602 (+) Transcript_487:216-2021(+)